MSSFCYSAGDEKESVFITIPMNNVLLYEEPTTSSPIVRRVFGGEVLKVTETFKTKQGDVWGKVYLSPVQTGYIQGVYIHNTGALQQEIWQHREVLRNEMPFSIGLKGPSELFGAGLQFRYLPFARFGFTAGAGSVLENGSMKGFSVGYGVVCMLSMDNVSPFVETGTSTLTFNDLHSTLRISTFYINAGVEWITESGYFYGLGVSYNRSYSVQIAYDYGYAKTKSGTLEVGDYGSFGNLNGAESIQRLNPLIIIGYSF